MEFIARMERIMDRFDILNEHINEADFSRYRRILKLILEQGCEKVLKKSSKPDDITFQIFDIIIQKLYYLGTWLYSIADHIAYHRMLNGCKTIYFEDNAQKIENYKISGGSITTKPTDTKNNTDGNNSMEYTIEAFVIRLV